MESAEGLFVSAASSMISGEQREQLRAQLQALGFDEVRFAAVEPSAAAAGQAFDDWLQGGMQADMAWMLRTAEKRKDVQMVLPGARTVVAFGVNYGSDSENSMKAEHPVWAHYALYEDYHETIAAGLRKAGRVLEEWGAATQGGQRWYVDTGPILERGWAARAGLGFRGKNGMLISRRYGNWLFLAVVVTQLEIAPDAPVSARASIAQGRLEEPAGLLCGKCTRCMVACPTNAIPRPGIVDARRCISYQTIENRGIIPRELRTGIGLRVYGCDVCLEVCPWNRFAQQAHSMLLVARNELAGLSLAELLALTPERFASVFRRTAVKRLKLVGLLRNACVVAGNSGEREHLAALAKLAEHESASVRAHAVWAVRRLAGNDAEGWLQQARALESDATVLSEYVAD